MNWLAHLHLSPPDPDTRMGSLLPDLLSRSELHHMDHRYARGINLHHSVDAFTDRHPVFLHSIRRLSGAFRRFGGIVIDVLYDHFLSRDWDLHSSTPRGEFISTFHRELDGHFDSLPTHAAERLILMRQENWLGSYAELDGVAETLRRIAKRLRRLVPLENAIRLEPETLASLGDDFREFYADLGLHVRSVL